MSETAAKSSENGAKVPKRGAAEAGIHQEEDSMYIELTGDVQCAKANAEDLTEASANCFESTHPLTIDLLANHQQDGATTKDLDENLQQITTQIEALYVLDTSANGREPNTEIGLEQVELRYSEDGLSQDDLDKVALRVNAGDFAFTDPTGHIVKRNISESSQVSTSSTISEDEAARRLEAAQRELEELEEIGEVDESVLKAAIRRKVKAEAIYAKVRSEGPSASHSQHDAVEKAFDSDQSARHIAQDSKGGFEGHASEASRTLEPLELIRVATEELNYLKQEGGVDPSVVEAAERRVIRAEEALHHILENAEKNEAHSLDGLETSMNDTKVKGTRLCFEDSSLLEPLQNSEKSVTLEVNPVSEDIDLEVLGKAISHDPASIGGHWLHDSRIESKAFGHQKLVFNVMQPISCDEIDRLCDELTDEFPGDIQSIEVKFHAKLTTS